MSISAPRLQQWPGPGSAHGAPPKPVLPLFVPHISAPFAPMPSSVMPLPFPLGRNAASGIDSRPAPASASSEQGAKLLDRLGSALAAADLNQVEWLLAQGARPTAHMLAQARIRVYESAVLQHLPGAASSGDRDKAQRILARLEQALSQ
jgi:hypothetical protein